ncbi:glutaredoxin [Paraliomyxa miuraensis]|uniref:glutaredoxin n=1 Tax=Paraliomyxa miuraensis TaxID=376150 RepID=UPI00224CF7EC|nr:glutaredoxin [Paraliomyxa miuraensis]MCX4246170.1 glutaredoxin [Paraliomyxa miuraensis]
MVPAPPGDLPAPDRLEAPVVLYTTPWCGFCRAALALLRARGIEHVEIDVMGNQAARQWLAQVTRLSTVPQVFVRGHSIGGYTELAQLDHSGELARLLAAPV